MQPASTASKNEEEKSRVFIVTEFADGSANSTGYYWSKIIDGLSEQFEQLHVICPQVSYEKVDSDNGKVTYILTRNISFNKKSMFSRLFGQILQSILFSVAIWSNVRRGDVIFSGTNPALLLPFIALVKALKGCKWLLLVHDVFPENLIAARVMKSGSVAFTILKGLFDRTYKTADILIAIGRDMQELLSYKTGRPERIRYLPNWADSSEIEPHEKSASSRGRKIIFQFFGNLGRLQGIGNLMEAIGLVKDERASFVFVGDGVERAKIEDYIHKHPDGPVSIYPSVPFSQSGSQLGEGDVAIVSLASGMNGLGVPSKAYFSLAADKPLLVVTDKESEISRLVTEEKSVGWFCEAESPHQLAALIDKICSEDLEHYRGKPRALLRSKYDYQAAMGNYAQLIRTLM